MNTSENRDQTMEADSGIRCQVCGNRILEQALFGDCSYCSLQLALSSLQSPLRQDGSPSTLLDVDEDHSVSRLPPDFGDYELISEIARGGMGVVYRAWQRSLDREVAIKLILAGQLASPESLERFRLEAQSAARMHHPGIVRIFEIGEFNGQQFFSMELIEGTSLAERLDDFRLRVGGSVSDRRDRAVRIAELMAEIARALNFAHSHGVLHRDLKPSNILIDGQGHPHLTDFGLAKLTGHADLGLTLTQAVLGTPGYLSPEQAAGNRDVTTAADIYGLGAMLYELLTGTPPFSGSTAVEAMWKSIHEMPRLPRSINPVVHRDLETIAMCCLEKRPEQRYASANDVADELQRFIDRKPILARPVSVSEQVLRWSQRNPVVSSITGLLLLAILFGTGVTLWQWSRAESANAGLKQSLTIHQWDAIDDRLRRDQCSTALAKTAALIRANPQDWKAAMLGISIVERSRFPIPLAPQIRHPDGAELSIARLAPDGKRIATASSDGTARIWDSISSIQLGPALEHADRVNWVEFSPDGHWVVTGSKDKSARLWNVETGQALCDPLLHAESVTHVHFSSDGRSLLTRTRRSISVIDLRDFKVKWEQTKPTGQIVLAKFSADGDRVCSAVAHGDDSLIETWDAQTGQSRLRLETGPLTLADASDDCSIAITGTTVGGTVWNLMNASKQSDFKSPDAAITKLYLDHDGRRFAFANLSGAIQVFDTAAGIPLTPKLSHDYHVQGGSFSKTDDQFLTWGDDSLVQIWTAGTGERICEPIRHSFHVAYAEYGSLNQQGVYLTATSHGKQRLPDTKTGTVQLWQIHDQKKPKNRRVILDSQQVRHWGHGGGKISPDGRWIALEASDDTLRVVEAETGKPVCDPLTIEGSPWGILFTPDCRRLVVATHQGQVSVRSLPSGELQAEPVKIPTMIQPAEMSVDGTQFATGSTDGFVRLWDVSTGRALWESSHGSEINSVAFSPNGALVAAAGENRITSIWDTRTGQRLKSLVGHENEVMSVAFSPNGRSVLTSSHDGTARVWSLETGGQQFLLPHRGALLEASFSPDGKLIATASRDRTAMIWNAETGQPHCRSLVSEHGVRNVRFSKDSRRLLVMDFQGLRIWDAELGIPLTVLLEQPTWIGTGFHSSTNGPQFGLAGHAAFLASDNTQAYLWDVPVPPGNVPSWFPEFLESIAGQRFIKGADIPEAISASHFLEMNAKILNRSGSDHYSDWAAKWLEAP
ncbi:WD40 repeat domain-containing serine/threonine protein kinase [Schlesneria paludicola]|uniref:WD40 repeat domain-containing serine/threonine protein kinase n=1 Tax=Schlesneria paludicola TaxID=360056 RepID=UPI00138AC1DE|nr:LpqB family beta-propeller domain-containing protein [Schlesneria paludicola]